MKIDTALQVFGTVLAGKYVGIDTVTEPAMRKTHPEDRSKPNPHFGRVTKHMAGANVGVYGNLKTNAYENAVNRGLAEEGKGSEMFVVGPRAWGHRIPGTAFVEHKGKLYIEMLFKHSGEVEYRLDGKPISKEEIIGLQESPGGEQGGLEDKVIIRTFAVENIVTVRADGKEWK